MTVGTYQLIDVDLLIPTSDNPRRLKRDKAFAELVSSISTMGVIQPLVARPYPANGRIADEGVAIGRPGTAIEDHYDLRAGHRRLAAAKEAGLKQVPVVVRELNDAEAMEVTVSENLQRENLTPLEESAGVNRLLEVGWEVQAIADRLGKPASWVARRAKLANLSDAWCEAYYAELDPKDHIRISQWPASLLEVIARLGHDVQDAILDRLDDRYDAPWSGPMPTTHELEKYVAAEWLHVLAGAPWKLDDATLVPEAGACDQCPKRSSQEPLLFDELDELGEKKIKPGSDRCLDKACYAKKTTAYVELKRSELEQKHGRKPIEIIDSRAGLTWEEERAMTDAGAVHSYNVQPAKKSDKDAVPAVVVAGSGAGTTRWVKPLRSTSSTKAAQKTPGTGKSMAEKRKLLSRRRQAHVITAVRDQLALRVEQPGSGLPGTMDPVATAIALAKAFGMSYRHDSIHCGKDPWKVFHAHEKTLDNGPDEKVAHEVISSVFDVMHTRLRYFNTDDAARRYPEALSVCALLDLDVDALTQSAAAAIPEPKSWSKAEKPKGKRGRPKKSTASKEASAEKSKRKRGRPKKVAVEA